MRHALRCLRTGLRCSGQSWSAWLCAATLGLLTLPAHRLDEVLHSTLVHIETATVRVACSLTPGASLSTRFIRAIDINQDGALSDLELLSFGSSYATNLTVRLNDAPLRMRLVDAQADESSQLEAGTGRVRLEFESVAPLFRQGTNHVEIFNHPPETNALCLIHAALPRQTNVVVLRQFRDTNQFENRIEFLWAGPSTSLPARRDQVQPHSVRRARE